MITSAFAAASAFVGGFFACATLNDGANGYLGSHLWIALSFTAVAALLAGTR